MENGGTDWKALLLSLAGIAAFIGLWVHLDGERARKQHDHDLVFGIAMYCSGAANAFDFKYPIPDGRGLWATQGCNGIGAFQRPQERWQEWGKVGYYCKFKNVEDCRPKGFHHWADDTDYRTHFSDDDG
jgi:hypothetical protein